MWKIISGIFLGWTLGSNDSANIFGTGVAAQIIKYKTAIVLISIFVILGAIFEGEKCFAALGKLSDLTSESAFFTALAAGLTMFILTYLALPCSTSQAIVGAILGAGIVSGTADFSRLYKIMLCWILAPISAGVISFMLYHIIGFFFERYIIDPKRRSFFIFWGLLFAGCFGAFALGSNNVANVTGIFVGSGLLTPFEGVLIGGLSIAGGVLTYSKKVMMTVGREITRMDEYSAFIAELSEAITVEIFTHVGVPVSTSQAIVGGVVGVGMVKGARTVNKNTVINIVIGWISTPVSAGVISYLLAKIFI
ncbi:MAG: inorganic phosphate transporter [Thermodesulfobacteriota bacterium]|nr:inorganic phosphate transporter [Thermodesulfobacteriota bacterium]